ncbi:ATP-binding protein [Saccharothrix stipae]
MSGGGEPPGHAPAGRHEGGLTVGNSVSGALAGVVQAGVVRGGVHLHAATPPPPMVPRQLPAAPGLFAGRAAELAVLDRALASAAPKVAASDERGATVGEPVRADPPVGRVAVVSAIGGAGGIGKTWLALAWANRNLDHFPDGQLFVDLRGFGPGEPRATIDVLADFLVALGVDRDHQPTDLDARVGLYRTHTTNRRMLVLLDNAARAEQVVPLLPGGNSCTVLITSRDRLHGLVARHSARPVRLDVLTDTEARTLLTTALGDTRLDPGTEWAITELIGLCGGFPLALGLIAARLRTRPDLLADLVAEQRDLGLDALESDDPTASLPTVLSWSLRHLTDQHRTLFALLGVAPGPDTTPSAVAALTDLTPARAHRALSALEEASLMERRPGGRYAMHDLVRDYAAVTAHAALPKHVRQTALTRVMDFHLHTAIAADRLLHSHRDTLHADSPAPGAYHHPLPDTAAALAWLEAEHATLLATQYAATALGHHRVAWHLAWALDTFHIRRGHRLDALASWQAALVATEHIPDPPTLIRTHRHLGNAYSRLGLHEQATDHLDQALSLAACHHDRIEQAHTHRVLGIAWELRRDHRRALDHARASLDLYRTLDQPVREAEALNSVGWLTACLGEFDTALVHCRRALTLHRHHHNLDGQAATLDSLAFIAHLIGDHRQALDHYHEALTLNRALGDIYRVANSLERVGHPHAALGQDEQARKVWWEASELYREQGREADAERVLRQLDELDRRNGTGRSGAWPWT